MFNIYTTTFDYCNLILTHSCNKKCPFCVDAYRGEAGYMSLEVVKKVLADPRLEDVQDVLLIGGEPTLHPEVVTIAQMVKDAGKKPILTTNYTKPTVVRQLDGIVDSFNISYYNQKELPMQRDFKSDLTLHTLIHSKQLNTKEALDEFIDQHQENGHLKFSTLTTCNAWTAKHAKVDYLDNLSSTNIVLFGEILGQIYRNAIIKRYDCIVGGGTGGKAWKISPDGTFRETWTRLSENPIT